MEDFFRIPPISFAISIENQRITEGSLLFAGTDLKFDKKGESHLKIEPVRITLEGLGLQNGWPEGKIHMEAGGWSFHEHGDFQLKLKPMEITLNLGGEKLLEALQAKILFKGIEGTDNGNLFMQVSGGAATITPTASADGEASPSQLNLNLEQFWFREQADKPGTEVNEVKLDGVIQTPPGAYITAFLRVFHQYLMVDELYKFRRYENEAHGREIISKQLLLRFYAMASEGLSLKIRQLDLTSDGVQGRLSGQIHWENTDALIDEEPWQHDWLLGRARFDLQGRVPMGGLADLILNGSTRSMIKRLIKHGWMREDLSGRIAFNLEMEEGEVRINGRDFRQLPDKSATPE